MVSVWLVLVLVGCSATGEVSVVVREDEPGAPGPESAAPVAGDETDFGGLSVRVGLGASTEERVLGQILVQALRDRGAEVIEPAAEASLFEGHDALVDRSVDTAWSFNGWAARQVFELTDVDTDGDALTAALGARDLAENGVRWIGRSPFSRELAIASASTVVADNNGTFTLETMAAWFEANPDGRFCLGHFVGLRPDGLDLIEDRTGFRPAEGQTFGADDRPAIPAMLAGECAFGPVLSSEGALAAADLVLVEAPGVFDPGNASLLIADEVYQQAPVAFDALVAELLEPLTTPTMIALSAEVEGGVEAAEVAERFLAENGIVERQ